jgi:prevent-host-death family protein
MSLTRDIRTVTEMKTRAAQLLDQVNQDRRPVVITQDGKPRAVMMDVESYEELRNSIGILKLMAQGEEDIRRGRWTKQDVMFDRLERRLKGLVQNGRKKA